LKAEDRFLRHRSVRRARIIYNLQPERWGTASPSSVASGYGCSWSDRVREQADTIRSDPTKGKLATRSMRRTISFADPRHDQAGSAGSRPCAGVATTRTGMISHPRPWFDG